MSLMGQTRPVGTLRGAWEEQAADWAKWARTEGHDHYHWRYNRPAFLSLLPSPGRLTLDVGCGEGRLGRDLVALGHRVVAVDASMTLTRLARDHDRPLEVARGDAAFLPLSDGVADLVTSYMVLQDVDDLDASVAELARVLVPGGLLCAAIVHPVVSSGFFAPGDSNHTFYLGGYLQQKRHALAVERDGLGMVFHSEHRPLEVYSRALEAAGLAITALREPAPGDDHVADHPDVIRHRNLPNFLHLRAGRL